MLLPLSLWVEKNPKTLTGRSFYGRDAPKDSIAANGWDSIPKPLVSIIYPLEYITYGLGLKIPEFSFEPMGVLDIVVIGLVWGQIDF